MHNEPGRIRRTALRALYFLTFAGLAPGAWRELMTHGSVWDPYYGVAVSFWAALSVLAAIGVVWPIRMLPLLLLQLLYKAAWLAFVGLPLYLQGTLTGAALDLAYANGFGVILDVLIIPWAYVVTDLRRGAQPQAAAP